MNKEDVPRDHNRAKAAAAFSVAHPGYARFQRAGLGTRHLVGQRAHPRSRTLEACVPRVGSLPCQSRALRIHSKRLGEQARGQALNLGKLGLRRNACCLDSGELSLEAGSDAALLVFRNIGYE